MTLFNPTILLLLIGLPAGIVTLVLLSVSLIVKRRNANWANAAELDAEPRNEAEAAAHLQYDEAPHMDYEEAMEAVKHETMNLIQQDMDDTMEKIADDEFYKRTLVEAKVQKLVPDFSTEVLGQVIFPGLDYPTPVERRRLHDVLKLKNPHVNELVRSGSGYRVNFKQVGEVIRPKTSLDMSKSTGDPREFDEECRLPPEVQAYVTALKDSGKLTAHYKSLTVDELSVLYPVMTRIFGQDHVYVDLCRQEINNRVDEFTAQVAAQVAAKAKKKAKPKAKKAPAKKRRRK